MRRRRKPKVVWLPTSNVFSVDTDLKSSWKIATVSVDRATAGATAVLEVPVVLDGNQSAPLDPTSSLADIENSGYRLRRIVGKLYCFIQAEVESAEAIVGVTAGFMVRRVDPETGQSFAFGFSSKDQANPALIDNEMDPWIWRRSWLLSDGPTFNGLTGALNPDEASRLNGAGGSFNFGKGYPGGNAEGPHIDQKTARVVGPEERLFLDVSVTTIIPSGTPVIGAALVVIYETRVLASMRSNIGNRRNASR